MDAARRHAPPRPPTAGSVGVMRRELGGALRAPPSPETPLRSRRCRWQYADYAIWQRRWLARERPWPKSFRLTGGSRLAGHPPAPRAAGRPGRGRRVQKLPRARASRVVLDPALADAWRGSGRRRGEPLFIHRAGGNSSPFLERYTGKRPTCSGGDARRPGARGAARARGDDRLLRQTRWCCAPTPRADPSVRRAGRPGPRESALGAYRPRRPAVSSGSSRSSPPRRSLGHSPPCSRWRFALQMAAEGPGEEDAAPPRAGGSRKLPPALDNPRSFDLTFAGSPSRTAVFFFCAGGPRVQPRTCSTRRPPAAWPGISATCWPGARRRPRGPPLRAGRSSRRPERPRRCWSSGKREPAPPTRARALDPRAVRRAGRAQAPGRDRRDRGRRTGFTYGRSSTPRRPGGPSPARLRAPAGVGPETLVALAAGRSISLVVATARRAQGRGAAYVPLDPSHPSERLAFQLADTRAPVLLTEERLAAALPGRGGRGRILLDRPEEPRGPHRRRIHRSRRTPVDAGGDRLAYVIYTSRLDPGGRKGWRCRHPRRPCALVLATN